MYDLIRFLTAKIHIIFEVNDVSVLFYFVNVYVAQFLAVADNDAFGARQTFLTLQIIGARVRGSLPDGLYGRGLIGITVDLNELAFIICQLIREVCDYVVIGVLSSIVEGVLEITMLTTTGTILACHNGRNIGNGIGRIGVETRLGVKIIITRSSLKC